MDLRSGKLIHTFPANGDLEVSENEDALDNHLHCGKHPLVIPEILQHIFGYLQVKHLTTCRLVSKFWNTTAIRSVREKSGRISFRDETPLNSFISHFSRSDASLTVNKFKLIFSEIMKHEAVYSRFFELVAPWMKELRLDFYHYYHNSYNGVNQRKQKLTIEYQLLEKLQVGMDAGGMEWDFANQRKARKSFLEFFVSVLTSAPKLNSLSVNGSVFRRDRLVTELLCDGDIAERLKNISCLHLAGGIADSDLENLANSEMKLTGLSIDFRFCTDPLPPNSSYSPCRFLESQASTLHSLEIKGRIQPDSVNFPTFTNLRAFTFVGNETYASWIPEINFRIQLPSVKKLVISHFTEMQNLEELILHVRDDSIDAVLTGLPLKKCKALNKLKLSNLKLKVENMNFAELYSQENVNPPLSKLQKLKILRLIVPSETRTQMPLGISKVITELVLKRMSNLKILDFGKQTATLLPEAESLLSNLKESFIVLYDSS